MIAYRLGALGAVLASLGVAAEDPAKSVPFRDEVAPILVRKCLPCHNDRKAEGGLNLSTPARLRQGGKTFGADVLVPGDPEASQLVASVRADAEPRMPYKLAPLHDAEVLSLERWVKAGAAFDGAAGPDTPLASLVDPLAGLAEVPVLKPASDPVAAVAFAPGGDRLAAARGRTVILFDVARSRQLATFPDHPGPISSLSFTPDGKALVTAGGRPGQFGSVTVWDIASATRRHDLRGHKDAILAAALAPDGKTLATAGYDRLVRLWNIASGQPLRELKEHTDAVHGVAFSPDGASLASASADRTVKVWDIATGRRRVTLGDATAEQYAVRFSPDGKTLLAGGVDRALRAWTLSGDTARLTRNVTAHDAPILRLILTPDGKTLVSCGEDRAIKLWDLPDLTSNAALSAQPDWPLDLALSPDGKHLAVGRYDGSLVVLDPVSGHAQAALLDAPGTVPAQVETAPKPAPPELVRNAALNPPSPRGAVRGGTVRVTLTGNGVGRSDLVQFDEPALEVKLIPPDKPDPNRLEIELAIAPEARVGVHRFLVRAPLGTPAEQSFAVAAAPEFATAEPDEGPSQAKTVALPSTLTGALDKPGDIDHVRFHCAKGQTVVIETLARGLGSSLSGTLAVLDASGNRVTVTEDFDTKLDPRLTFTATVEGLYTLRIGDAEYGGSANHFYRIAIGSARRVDAVFPLGVGLNGNTLLQFSGANLGDDTERSFSPPHGTEPGAILPASVPDDHGGPRVVAALGPQGVEAEGNDEPQTANPFSSPGGISGRINQPGDLDHFRFQARKGQPTIVEAYATRLGTPVDPLIEILDAQGRPVPRAVLRPVASTNVAFRDHGSATRTVRLTVWNDLAVGDHLLLGRELTRISELPRNPDDDAVLWGLGIARTAPGERLGFLETTPEQHPMGQAIHKVEIHPPGAIFAPGGVPPVTLFHRNDDGGPGFGKDARLSFDPPEDGTYIVRVEDARGFGGGSFGYHLLARAPRPDFRLSLGTENPNIPRGGTALLIASVRRLDGFDAPIDVTVDGLPPGLSAVPTRIEKDQYAAELGLSAAENAPAVTTSAWSVTARAVPDPSAPGVPELVHTLQLGKAQGGWITVTPTPNLKVRPGTSRLVIRPGEQVPLPLAVERGPAFTGRVPIDVRNLPFGVRVLNIGLNGVLITEKETERTASLYADPWVLPQTRHVFAVGRCEAAGTEHASPPIELVVEPAASGSR